MRNALQEYLAEGACPAYRGKDEILAFEGFAGHAGAVPMPLRQDAMTGASILIQHIVNSTMKQYPYDVTATIGKLELLPGSSNCIPSKCTFTVDLRSGEMDYIDELTEYIKKKAEEAAGKYNLKISVDIDSRKAPVRMEERLRQILKESCDSLGYSYRNINSGAGHDAMVFASRWPTAMLFV